MIYFDMKGTVVTVARTKTKPVDALVPTYTFRAPPASLDGRPVCPLVGVPFRRPGPEGITAVDIDYSFDGGTTWHHGRTVAASLLKSPNAITCQRKYTLACAKRRHPDASNYVTRVLVY